jgi:hypothetical protein
MRTLIIGIVIAVIIIPALAQPVWIGGDFGKSWLANFGNKNVVPKSTSFGIGEQYRKGRYFTMAS